MLWRQKATILTLVSGGCWFFFFGASVVLQLLGLSYIHYEGVTQRKVDIIAGQLPSPLRVGGQRRLILGAPQEVRHSLYWKVFWGIGSIVCTASVVVLYVNLGRQETTVFAIWTGFQFLWLALRSVFYHFGQATDRIFHHPMQLSKDWKMVPTHFKSRIRRLIFALSKYQMHVHPRGAYCYEEDVQSCDTSYNMQARFILTPEDLHRGEVTLSVVSIVGDTLLSSATWLFGSKLSGMDLYDSCIVVLELNCTTVAIPSARVLSGKPRGKLSSWPSDEETGVDRQFPPRGGSNTGTDITWWYWIPCGEGKWLQTHSEDMRFLGKRTASIVSDEQVTKTLASGELLVGISEVGHVHEIVRNSVDGSEVLQNILC